MVWKITQVALLVLFAWTGLIPAAEPNPPSEIGIYQNLQAMLSDSLKVRIYVYNRTDQLQAYEGDVIDDKGKLLLSGGWDLILQEIKEGKIISSRSLRIRKFPPVLHNLKANKYDNWDWQVNVSDLTDHPGNYRFQLKYKHLTYTGQLFRIVDTLQSPDFIKLAYVSDKRDYFIGEPITLKFKIKNNGTDDFVFERGADYRGASRSLRFYFTATNKKGEKAIDPKPHQICMGGIGGPISLKPGEVDEIELPLLAYLSFPSPGTYTVKAYQALGFGQPDKAIAKANEYRLEWQHSYGASFEINLRAPTHEEIQNLITTRLAVKDRYERRRGFSHIHNSIYLKPLLKTLKNETDEHRIEALVAGIGSILTVESTRCLIELARDERTAVRINALELLFLRLPLNPNSKLSAEFQNPPYKKREIELAWDETLRPPIAEIVKQSLKSTSPDYVSAAALCIWHMGDPNCLLLLADAADRIAPHIPVPEENARTVNRLASVAWSSHDYGFEPIEVNKNSSPGRLAVWVVSVSRHKEKHTEQWEDLVLHMMNLDCSLTQYHAIRWLPRDFRKRDQVPWAKLLSAKDSQVWRYALHKAMQVRPSDLKAIVTQVLNETEDNRKRQDLKDWLKKID